MSTQSELLERFKEYADRAAVCTKNLEDAQESVISAVDTITEKVTEIEQEIKDTIDTAMEEAMEDGSAAFVPGTDEEAGKGGMVPAPTVNDNGKFLKGDGTWSEIKAEDVDGGKKTIVYADTLPETAPEDLIDGGFLVVGTKKNMIVGGGAAMGETEEEN